MAIRKLTPTTAGTRWMSVSAFTEITKTHPGVREVLKKFQKERALSTVQAIMADKG